MAIHRDRKRAALWLVLVVLSAGCAKNPVTGHRQLMLISDQQEFSIGEGADKEIRQSEGVYLESPALRTYVDGVGNALVKKSERSGIVYHFAILNSPEVNAFALPGGFVYVTRGMLERLSSEDQLAMVMGHEIGHVAARHGAARISSIYALQYGTLVGAIISPRTFVNYNDLINIAMQVGLSRYSREQEKQADDLGIVYAADAGYRPEEAIKVMEILKWLEGSEPGTLEKWFLSHPPAAERIADLTLQADRLEKKEAGSANRAPVRRDPYLRQIDGLIVGLYNGSEMVLKDRYYNKELGVSLSVPQGWEVDLDPNGALASFSRKAKERIVLESEPMHTEENAADIETRFDETLKRRGYTRTGGSETRTRQDMPVRIATYTASTAKGEPVGIYKGYLVSEKREWIFTAMCEAALFAAKKPAYEEVLTGMNFLTGREAAALSPPRLQLIEISEDTTWGALAAKHLDDPKGGERLAFYNGLKPDSAVTAGMLVKIPPSLSVRP